MMNKLESEMGQLDNSNEIIKLAIGSNIRDVNIRNVKLSWDDFRSYILSPKNKSVDYNIVDNSNGEYSHDEIIKKAISTIKPNLQYFVGGYFNILKRSNDNLHARTLIVLDIAFGLKIGRSVRRRSIIL